jgi:hypothetical protein
MQSTILGQSRHSCGMGESFGRLARYPKASGQSVFASFSWCPLELRIKPSTFLINLEPASSSFSEATFSDRVTSSSLTVGSGGSGSSLVKQKGQASYCFGGVTDRLVRRIGSSISLPHFVFGQTTNVDSSGNLIASRYFLLNSSYLQRIYV